MSTEYGKFIKKSTNIRTWINDLGVVSKASEDIKMSIAALGVADYSKALDGLSLSQAKLLFTIIFYRPSIWNTTITV